MENSRGHRTRTIAGFASMLRRVKEKSTSRQRKSGTTPSLRHTGGYQSMPDSRLIDQQSRRLIREELLTDILVEAGAGSGKTQMLAERMAAGVAAGVYALEHM